MNKNTTYRITVSLPLRLRDQMLAAVPARGVSGLVTTALEKYFLDEATQTKNPALDFLKQAEKLPRRTAAQIEAAIKKDRT